MKINTIHNGDCTILFKEFIKEYDNFIIITDPPYNQNFKYNGYKDNLNDDDYINLINTFKGYSAVFIHYPEETIKYLSPALGVPDEICVWCYNSNLPRQSRLINFYNVAVNFNNVKQPYKNPTDKRVRKLIENGSQGTRSYDWFSDIQIVKNVSKEKGIHPCPIPEKLIERIIKLSDISKDTIILDPFSGGGTTCKVAKNMGYNFVGFELDETYYKKSLERLDS